MFITATIQSTVSGTPTQAGQVVDADEREREVVDPDPEDRPGSTAARTWPASFSHQRRPRKSSIAPTAVATAAPSRMPAHRPVEVEEGERRDDDPEEEREPAEPRDRDPVDAPLVGDVDDAEPARHARRPPGVSRTTITSASDRAVEHLEVVAELVPQASRRRASSVAGGYFVP